MNIGRTQYQNNQFAPKALETAEITPATSIASPANGSVLAFNSLLKINNGLLFNTATSTFTAKAKKRYKMKASILSGAAQGIQFRDITNNQYIGIPSDNSNYGDPVCSAEIYYETDTNIQLWKTVGTAGVTIYASNSWWSIEEIQSNEQPNTYPFEMNANQVDLTVTGTNWTTTRAKGVAYKTIDGTWRLRFNIDGAVPSSTYTGMTLNVAGVTFKNGTNQVCAALCIGPASPVFVRAKAISNASTIEIYHVSASSLTNYECSGDVELESKPTWI